MRHSGENSNADDLTLTRRAAMALLGVGTLIGGVGSGAAAAKNDEGPPEQLNQDAGPQGLDLRNIGELHAEEAWLERVYTAARGADVIVWKDDDDIYHADGRDGPVQSGEDFTTIVQAAIDSLEEDRTEKGDVVVACSGTMGPHEWDGDVLAIEIPSYTRIEFLGTIYVEDENEALVRTLRARDAEEIEIPRVKIVGNFRSAIWFKGVRNVKFGHIDIRTPEDSLIEATGGAVRIDGGRDIFDETIRSKDIQVDSGYFEGLTYHAFETYNVDRIQVGQIVAKDIGAYEGTGGCGVLLNGTTNATVGAVIGENIDPNGGYAAFRVANGTHDVTCDQVICNGGARGFFGVSGCHDVTIGKVNIQETDAHGALIQDCQNVTIQGGVFKNCQGEAIRVDSRSSAQHPPAEGVNVSNVRIVDNQDEKTQTYGINETGPGTANNRFIGNDLRDAGTEANMSLFAPSTIVRDNIAGGVAHGTVTLSSGSSPAGTVEGISGNGAVNFDLRAKPREAPGGPFGIDHRFEWDGEQWNLHFEWVTDPGEDVDVDYIVDRPQANIGLAGPSEGDDDDGGTEVQDGNTYTVTAQLNADDIVMSVDGDVAAGSNVYMETQGETAGQQWTMTDLGDGLWRIDVADNEGLVLTAAEGGTDTGTNLIVEDWAGEDYQKWELNENGPGYTLEPSHANLAADVWERDTDPGADIRHWTPGGGENQTFVFRGEGDDGQEAFPFETTEGVVESFEDGNFEGYNGATGEYEVTDADPVAHGDYSLKGSGGEGTQIVTTDLDRSPAPGTTFSAKIGWTSSAPNACFAFGANETTEPADGDGFPFHFVRLWQSGEDDWRFQFWDRTGGQLVRNSLGSTESDAFYEVVIDWAKDGSMTITLNDPDGNEVAVHELADVGGGTDWGDGGIGSRGTGLLDDVRILENRR